MSLEVVIAGARGAGLKVVQILEDQTNSGIDHFKLIGFIDDNEQLWETVYFGYPVLGPPEILPELSPSKTGVICPIGDPVNRFRMIERLKPFTNEFPNAIHPSAQVSSRASMGHGNIFSQNVVIQAGVRIGNFNSLNINAIMGPLSILHNFCTLNAHTMIASETEVQDYTYIGMGANILQRLAIPTGVTVGANAVVTKTPEAWTTLVGVPAKEIKRRPDPFN